MSNERDLKIYRTLFRKVNLDDYMLYIPEYMQPLIYMTLESDEMIQELLKMMCYVGEYIHYNAFKEYVLEMKISTSDKDRNIEEKKFISRTNLNTKLRIMELVGLIEIIGYRIKLSSQALSYCNDSYTKVQSRYMYESKLEKVTKAKLLAYTLAIVSIKNNSNLERVNIYRYSQDGFIVSQSNEDETFNQYKYKLNMIVDLLIYEINEQLYELSKDIDVDDPKFKSVQIDDYEINVYIEDAIYKKYNKSINDILESKFLTKDSGYRITVYTNLNFNVKCY